MPLPVSDCTEWLETDGLGGFASGTTSGVRTRRYHGLLLAASKPPTGRFVLVSGLDVTVRTPEGDFPLAFHRYAPGVTNPTEGVHIESFTNDPWPRWVFRLRDGGRIGHEVFVTKGTPRTVVSWRLLDPRRGVRLLVRPLLSGRDYHALHHENPVFRFSPSYGESWVRWSPYPGVPSISATHNAGYRHDPLWYRGFQYDRERERGFDCTEDLASPGVLEFGLSEGEATLVLSSDTPGGETTTEEAPRTLVPRLRAAERKRRDPFASQLERAADAYLVRREHGTTILAGYPWFADWGRDTFIALRALPCHGASRGGAPDPSELGQL